MSDLILAWLNKDIGLSKKVNAFERDFANGYLFGEILFRHGLLQNFQETFVDQSEFAKKTSNFQRLVGALRDEDEAKRLGVLLKQSQVEEIMSEDRGSALRLLYQLRKGLQQAGVKPQPVGITPRKQVLNEVAGTGAAAVAAARGAQKDLTSRLAQPREQTMRPYPTDPEHFFYDNTLKALPPGHSSIQHELHNKAFVHEHARQLKQAAEEEEQERQQTLRNQSTFKAKQVTTRNETKLRREAKNAEGEATWQVSMGQRNKYLQKDLAFEQERIAKHYARIDRERGTHEEDCGYRKTDEATGIAAFERNLQRIGIDTSDTGHIGDPSDVVNLNNLTVKQLYGKMRNQMPSQATMSIEAGQRMQKIREKKRQTDMAGRERERRQLKTQVETAATAQKAEDQRQEEDLLAQLLRDTAKNQREAAEWDEKQRRKQQEYIERKAKHENFDQRYAKIRKENKYLREAEEAFEMMRQHLRDERAAKLAEKAAAKERLELMRASGITPPVVEVPPDDSSDEDPDDGPWSWHGDSEPLTGSMRPRSPTMIMSPHSATAISGLRSPVAAPGKELLEVVQDSSMTEYLFARGDWSAHQPTEEAVVAFMRDSGLPSALDSAAPAEEPRQSQLGNIVRWLVAPSTQSEAANTNLPSGLPIVVVENAPALRGGTDRSTTMATAVAKNLCEKLAFTLLEPRKVLEEALALAQKDEQEPEWPVLARMHQIGRCLMELPAEAGVPHTLYAEAVFRKIELLAVPPPPKKGAEDEEAAVDPKAKKKPDPKAKKGKTQVVEEDAVPEPAKGIVICGFPTDLGQHAAWEACLSGYCSPLWRVLDSEADQHLQVSSVLAPWKHESTLAVPSAGADYAPEVPILQIQHPDAGSLRDAVIQEAFDPTAWVPEAAASTVPDGATTTAPAAGAGDGGEDASRPVLRCKGHEQELAQTASPVDRAWLDANARALAQPFQVAVGTCSEVLACREAPGEAQELGAPSGDAASAAEIEEACCRRAFELVGAWQSARERLRASSADPGKAEAEATGSPTGEAAGNADAAPAAENSAEEAAAEASPKGAEQEEPTAVDTAQNAQDEPEGRWDRILGAEARGALRAEWLSSMSAYLAGLKEALTDVQEHGASYGNDIVTMQRKFLEFLQRNDSKPQVLDDFLKMFPPLTNFRSDELSEDVESFSDRLWTFADQRRAEAAEERSRLMTGGFWEQHVAVCLRLAERLQTTEYGRYRCSVALLLRAHGHEVPSLESEPPRGGNSPPGQEPSPRDRSAAAGGESGVPPPEGLSSAEEVAYWLHGITQRFSSDDVLPFILANAAGGERAEALRTSLLAEQVAHVRRLRMVQAWAIEKVASMRRQLTEVFHRTDDWIRQRVKEENDAIRAAVALLINGAWDDEAAAGRQPGDLPVSPSSLAASVQSAASSRSHGSKGAHKVPPSPTGGPARKRRQQLLKALEPRTLDVDVFQPPKRDGAPLDMQPDPIQGSYVLNAALRPGSPPKVMSRPGRWSFEMLSGLMWRLAEQSRSGVISDQLLLEVLLERYDSSFSFESSLLPAAWVQRSYRVFSAFCKGLLAPEWGGVAVDITELIINLTLHERALPWPSAEALDAIRRLLESEESGLTSAQRAEYPDVPISEDLFMRLPLWSEDDELRLREEPWAERLDQLRWWLFQVFLCFEVPSKPQPPVVMKPGQVRPRTNMGSISARRLFTYFSQGATPTDGLQRSLRTLLPPTVPAAEVGGDDDANQGEAKPRTRVQDLWNILFSRKGRPAGVSIRAPALTVFFGDFVSPVEKPKTPPPTKGGAAPKDKAAAKAAAKGGNKPPSPTEDAGEETGLNPADKPEDAVLTMSEKALLRHPTVTKALCSHGALHCRSRALQALFPDPGATALLPSVLTTAEVAQAQGLAALNPRPGSSPQMASNPTSA